VGGFALKPNKTTNLGEWGGVPFVRNSDGSVSVEQESLGSNRKILGNFYCNFAEAKRCQKVGKCRGGGRNMGTGRIFPPLQGVVPEAKGLTSIADTREGGH